MNYAILFTVKAVENVCIAQAVSTLFACRVMTKHSANVANAANVAVSNAMMLSIGLVEMFALGV
jgi:hypothetical protein